MTESKHYRIVFKGNIREGFSPDDVKSSLAKRFKLNQERTERIFSGRPVVIKKDVDRETVGKYRAAFHKAGAICIVQVMPSAMPAPMSSAKEKEAARPEPVRKDPPRETPTQHLSPEPSEDVPSPPDMLPDSPEAGRPVTEDDLWRGMVGVRQQPKTTGEPEPKTVEENHIPDLPIRNETTVEKPEPSVSGEQTSQLERAKAILRQSLVPEGEDVKIEVTAFTSVEFFIQNLVVGLLSYVIVGFFLAPRKIFGFLAGHVLLNGKKMTFDSIWMFVFSFGAVGGAYFLVFILFYFLVAVFGTGMMAIPLFMFGFLLFPFVLGVGIMSMIQSLSLHTTVDNIRVTCPLFSPDPEGFIRFVRENPATIYLWGLASLSGLFLLLPVTWAVLLKEWHSRIEVDGYRYEITIPWNKVVLYSVGNLFCFGLLIFRFIRVFYEEVIPNGEWIKVPEVS